MQSLKLAAISVALILPTELSAEIAIGGWANFELDGGTSPYARRTRTNTLVTYSSGEFVAGIGVYNEWSQGSAGFFGNPVEPYYLLAYGNAVVSYGYIYGAGNLFPEDYFGFDDTTSVSDQVLRLDVQFGAHNFAISNDLNGSSLSEIELGYSGVIQGFDVAAGFEADSDQVSFLIGRDFGNWGVQLATVQDLLFPFGPWDHAGVTIFRDFDNGLTLAGNVAYGTNGTVGLHSYGVIATYDAEFALLKAEFNRSACWCTIDMEIGIVVPFGKKQPAAAARFTQAEYRRRFVR